MSLPLVAAPATARAYAEASTLRDKASGVTLRAPYGWVLHKQTGYPELRGLLVHRKGDANIALMVGHLAPGQGLEAYIKENCQAMIVVGVAVKLCGRTESSRPLWRRVDGVNGKHRRRVEQYYRTEGGQVIILSLSAASGVAARRSADLWRVLDTLIIPSRNTEKPTTNTTRAVNSMPNKASPMKEGEALPELPGGEQVLADELLTDGSSIDEQYILDLGKIGKTEATSATHQPDIEEERLEVAVVGFGSQGDAIGCCMADLVNDSGQAQQMQRAGKLARPFVSVHVRVLEAVAHHARDPAEDLPEALVVGAPSGRGEVVPVRRENGLLEGIGVPEGTGIAECSNGGWHPADHKELTQKTHQLRVHRHRDGLTYVEVSHVFRQPLRAHGNQELLELHRAKV